MNHLHHHDMMASAEDASAAQSYGYPAQQQQQRLSPLSVPFPLRDVTAATAQAENRRQPYGVGGKVSPLSMPPQGFTHHGGSAPISPVMGSPSAAALQFAALQAAAFAAAATMSSLSQGLSPVGVVPLPPNAPGSAFPMAPMGLPLSGSFSRLDGVSPTNSEYRRIRQNDPYSASVLPQAFEEQAAASRAESALTAGNSPTSVHPVPVPWGESDNSMATAALEHAQSFCVPQSSNSAATQQQQDSAAPTGATTTTTSSLVKVYLNGRPTVSPKTSPIKSGPQAEQPQQQQAATEGTQQQQAQQQQAASSPKAAAASAGAAAPASPTTVKKWQAVVSFRQRTGVFCVDNLAPIAAVGSYVMVQGDRGVDMGKVLRMANADDIAEAAGQEELRVLRVANPAEINKWAALVRDEASALENVKRRTKEILGEIPDFEILATEYQFDRLKLFVYYKSNDRVYFVPLLKSLNATYHCRIWMEVAVPKPQAHHHTSIGQAPVMPLTGGTVTIGNRTAADVEIEQLALTTPKQRRGGANGRKGHQQPKDTSSPAAAASSS